MNREDIGGAPTVPMDMEVQLLQECDALLRELQSLLEEDSDDLKNCISGELLEECLENNDAAGEVVRVLQVEISRLLEARQRERLLGQSV